MKYKIRKIINNNDREKLKKMIIRFMKRQNLFDCDKEFISGCFFLYIEDIIDVYIADDLFSKFYIEEIVNEILGDYMKKENKYAIEIAKRLKEIEEKDLENIELPETRLSNIWSLFKGYKENTLSEGDTLLLLFLIKNSDYILKGLKKYLMQGK